MLEQMVADYLSYKEQIKTALKAQKQLMDEILKTAKIGDQITLPDGRVVTVKNNFAEKDGSPTNSIWRPLLIEAVTLEVK